MAEDIKLQAKIRKEGDQKRDQRIPGILYGKGVENIMLWVEKLDFEKTYEEAGESTLIDLEVKNGKSEPHKVLIYDTQPDPISGDQIHVDFYQVRMDEEIETDVELVFEGESPAVKESGGVLIKNIDSVTVRCLPANLPKEIKVDISALKTFEDRICIKDLKISSEVQIDLDPKTAISVVNPPRSEEELEDLDKEVEGDISQVEGMEEEVEGEEAKEETVEDDDVKEEAEPEEEKPEENSK